MTSLIAEVLGGAAVLERETLAAQMEKLQLQLQESKSDIYQLIQVQYVDFVPSTMATARMLSAKSDQLSNEVDQQLQRLKLELEEDADSAAQGTENAEMKTQLEEVESCLSSLRGVASVASSLEELEFLSPSAQPLASARLLVRLEAQLGGLGDEGELVDSRVFAALKEEIIVHREGLIYSLLEWWKDTFHMSSDGDANKLVVADVAGNADARERLAALRLLEYADAKVEQLGKALFSQLYAPLLTHKTTLEEEKSARGQAKATRTLRLRKLEPRPDSEDPLLKAKSVLESLGRVTSGVEALLGAFLFPAEEETLLRSLGRFVGGDLQDLVVSGLLKPAVPADAAAFPAFEAVLAGAAKGEARLRGLGLLGDRGDALADFAKAKQGLLIDRRCQRILSEGRELITSELHDLVEVGTEKDERDPLSTLDACLQDALEISSPANAAASVDEVKIETERRLPPVFRFPRCKVSSSVVSLVGLVERTLAEAAEAESADVSGRLFLTARSLLDLFLQIAPAAHAHNFANIPPFAAAFYNNCYYLSHRLMTLGWEVTPKLAPRIGLGKDDSELGISFVDLIPRLRELASEILEAHIRSRTELIAELLQPTKGFRAIVEGKRERVVEKALRAATLQLEQVGRVWRAVMTKTVYLKSMGRLSVAVLKGVTKPILALEDIPAPDSDFLAAQMEAMIPILDALFDVGEGSQAAIFGESAYYRFKEIVFCLQGSLQSISDRWAQGSGPLGTYLSPSELKALVRALFQNTDRRAAFLASVTNAN